MKIATRKIVLLALLLTTILACKSGVEKEIKAIPIKVTAWDIHKDLAAIRPEAAAQGVADLTAKYGDIIPFLFQHIVRLNTSSGYDSLMLQQYFADKDYKSLMDTVAIAYPNTDKITDAITSLFRHISYYDSSIAIPDTIVYYTAALHESAFTRDGVLGIGLDKFLGPEFWPYEAVGIGQYESRKFVSGNIPVVVASLLFENEYGITPDNKTLLDLMLHEGRRLLFSATTLPSFSEQQILGFTAEQWKWCEENEMLIYDFFKKENLLYEKSPIKTMRYIAPAPTSQGMPKESPGYTGGYIGYKILKSYQKATGKSLASILREPIDATTLLKNANYKPNK